MTLSNDHRGRAKLKFRFLGAADYADVYRMTVACGLWPGISEEAWGAFVDWAVFGNPYRADRPLGDIASTEQGELVGSVLYVYFPVRLGDDRLVAVSPTNVAIRAEYRGLSGLAITRSALQRDEFPVVFASHANRLGAALFARSDAKPCPGSDLSFFGTLSMARRISRVARTRGGLLGALDLPGLRWAGVLAAGMTGHREISVRAMPSGIDPTFELASNPPDELDVLCQAALNGVNVAIDKNANYLRWRYGAGPYAGAFRCIALRGRGGTLAGLAVLQRNPDGLRYALCEALAVPEAREALAIAAIETARGQGAVTLQMRQGDADWAELWQSLGFKPIQTPYHQFWVHAKGDAQVPEAIVTHYSFGDHKFHWSGSEGADMGKDA